MNRIISAVVTASALIFGVFLPREEAVAQTAKDLVGTWTLVSVTLEQDGKKTDMYGANPQGQVMYGADGHLSVIITRSDLPKFASNNRVAGTPEENTAIVQGSLAYFGTYSVSETDKNLLPPTLRAVRSRIGTGSIEKLLSAFPETNSAPTLFLGH